MTDSPFSVRVYIRRTARSRWVYWQTFASGAAAAEGIREAKRLGKLRVAETLAVRGDVDPNGRKR